MPAPLVTAALISAGSNLIGGLLGRSSAKDQNRQADAQAQREMEFQERMSSTAHQREVEDLKKAGLNPILSAHGGASSPGGAMAPVVNTSEPLRDSINKSAGSALDAANIMLTKETAKTQQTQQELNRANAAKSLAEASGHIGLGPFARIPISRLGGYLGNAVSSAKSAWNTYNPVALGRRAGLHLAEMERKG